MILDSSKIVGEGLTYDDVLLVPAFSEVLPREVNTQTKFTKNITFIVPIVSAFMNPGTAPNSDNAHCRKRGIGRVQYNTDIHIHGSTDEA